jgi:hypothetical protein
MIEIDSFYNDGFGWACRQCSMEISAPPAATHSRMFTEGEAESKGPKLTNFALAKWTDKTQEYLVCPRCGVTEKVDKR